MRPGPLILALGMVVPWAAVAQTPVHTSVCEPGVTAVTCPGRSETRIVPVPRPQGTRILRSTPRGPFDPTIVTPVAPLIIAPEIDMGPAIAPILPVIPVPPGSQP